MMKYALPLLTLLPAPLAFAHPGHVENANFIDGFLHPLLGFDHLLAMLAVGLWSVGLYKNRPTSSLLLLPAVFVFFLIDGMALGALQTGLPAIEPMIAVSLLVLGVAAGIGRQIPQTLAATLVGLFAVFHGYAHGAELGGNVRAIVGVALATALLHIAGIGLGSDQRVRRVMAAFVAAGGVFFLLQLA